MKLHDYLIFGLIVVVAIHFASHAGRRPVHAPRSAGQSGTTTSNLGGPAPTASGGGAAGGSSGQSSCA